jgi:glyoxylase-like metal-dependent hydrolase (beta-lactamase superfamily II)
MPFPSSACYPECPAQIRMQIAPHCYAITGLAYIPPWSVNAGFVVGRHTTLILDTSASAHSAATIHGYATLAAPQNRLLVINTEKHFDHIGGNSFFRGRSVDVLAHPDARRTASEFAAEKQEFNRAIPDPVRRRHGEQSIFYNGTELAAPTKFISHPATLDLGDLDAHVILTPGHTPSNLSVYIAADGVLFSGDCVVTGYLPNLDCGGPSDWRAWLSSLEKIEQLAPKFIVPGHGPVVRNTDVQASLSTVRKYIEDALRTGTTPTGKTPR